ncbi:MAG: nucleoside triphosphate pyrophosphohydrolase family protein [Cytophagales bacterium]|nr:nucleoside triphosphate pyrophosphohydrolase family protein [Cytophagales bacterium]
MDFNEYQDQAKTTIQKYHLDESINGVIPFLGIVGEAGSVLTELKKKIRDGESYTSFKERLIEELGDVLWYVSAIATQNNIELEKVASFNLEKTNDRFNEDDPKSFKNYDKQYPEHERFPGEFEVEFKPVEENGKKTVQIIDKRDGELLGDPLTDNSYEDDGYRFHDIFHYGYLAYLGWSPVIRKLMKLKRKSEEEVDENEDGARAQITEELVSLFIYNHAQDHQLLKYSKSVDTDVLKIVKQLVSQIEVKDCSAKQWEIAILSSYRVFNLLRQNNGGRVLVSLKNRELIYIGKN